MDLICSLPAPPYAITTLSNGYFLVAGGGGAAKTGVKNFVTLYQLRKRDSGQFYASLLHEYTPEGCAIMNFAALGQAETCLLLLGEDTYCKEYLLKRKHSTSEFNVSRPRARLASGTVRYRGLSFSDEMPISDEAQFELVELRRVQSCVKSSQPTVVNSKNKDDGDVYQTCVRLSSDLTYLVTGCSDGQVNIYRYVDDVLPTVHSFRVGAITMASNGSSVNSIATGETVPIDDLDVSPTFGPHAELSVVAAGSARCSVHRVSDGTQIRELVLDERAAADCAAFRFRNVRYTVYVSDGPGSDSSVRNRVLLVSSHKRIRRQRSDRRSILVAAWSCSVYGPPDDASNMNASNGLKRILYPYVGSFRVYDDEPATLAVNDNGHLIGVGTQEGAVHVLRLTYTHVDAADGRTVDARASFSTIYHVREAHATFVTGIAFLPSAVSEQERCDALLLSQSVDLRVLSHAVRATSPKLAALKRTGSILTIFIRLLVAVLAITVICIAAGRTFTAMHQTDSFNEANNNRTPAEPHSFYDIHDHSSHHGEL